MRLNTSSSKTKRSEATAKSPRETNPHNASLQRP